IVGPLRPPQGGGVRLRVHPERGGDHAVSSDAARTVVGAGLVPAPPRRSIRRVSHSTRGGHKGRPHHRPAPVPLIVTHLVAASFALAQPPVLLTARFIGNMAFAITDGKTTLYSDYPYEPGAFGYMSYDFAKEPKAADCLCLITHGHRDHFDPALFR